MENNFKPIEIIRESSEVEEVSLDEAVNPKNEEPKEEISNNETVENEPKEEIQNKDKETAENDDNKNVEEITKEIKKEKKKKRTSRSQKRIQELASQKAELLAELEKERILREELEKQVTSKTKMSHENVRETKQQAIDVLNVQWKAAMENGDYDQALELQDKIVTAKMELAGLDSEINRLETVEEEQKKVKPKVNKQQEVPQEAYDWIEEHPQIKTDPVFQAASIAVNNVLINEGWDPSSEEFYEELNKRLSPRFPEIFGIEEKDDVKYVKSSSEDGEADVKVKETNDKKPSQQTVSGASRAPSETSFGAKPSRKKSIVLSPEVLYQAEKWGFSKEEMAERVEHIEKSRDSNGFVPIMIKK